MAGGDGVDAAISLQQSVWDSLLDTISNLKSDFTNLLSRITNTENNIATIQESIRSGSFVIPIGSKTAKIIYQTPFSSTPSAQITLASPLNGHYTLTSSTPQEFIVSLSTIQNIDITFNWLSCIGTESATVEILNLDPTVSPTSTPTLFITPLTTPYISPTATDSSVIQ